jgi:hypothetical protein
VKEDHPGLHQEEADTKMFLRGKHAMDNGFQSIVIRSSDTDVEVLACFFSNLHGFKLFIVSGMTSKFRIVDISAIC